MGAALGVLLLAGGAVLRWAVADSHWEGLDLEVTGMILMVVGIIALAWSVILYVLGSNGDTVVHDRVVEHHPDEDEPKVVVRRRTRSPKRKT